MGIRFDWTFKNEIGISSQGFNVGLLESGENPDEEHPQVKG